MAEHIHRLHRPRPRPSHTPTQYLTLLVLHLLALVLRFLSLLTPLLVPSYYYLTTALTTLRTPTLLDTPYFDVFLSAFLLCYFPAWVWWGVKVAAKGLLGHAVFGALAVRWFEKCAGEWVPVVRVAGWEVVVRGEGRGMGKAVVNEVLGRGGAVLGMALGMVEEWLRSRLAEGTELGDKDKCLEGEKGKNDEKKENGKDDEKKDKKDNEKDNKKDDEKNGEVVVYSGVTGELFTLPESERVEVGEGWLAM